MKVSWNGIQGFKGPNSTATEAELPESNWEKVKK